MPDSSAMTMVDAVMKVGPALSATTDMPTLSVSGVGDTTPESTPEKTDTGTGPDKPGEETPSEKGDETGTETPGEAGEPKSADQTPPHVKAQISRAKNRAAEATKELNEYKDLVKQLLARLPETQSKTAPESKTPDTPRPKRDSFDNPDAYETALDAWHAQQQARAIKDAVQQFKAQAEEETRSKTFNEIRDKWTERREAFAATHEDYVEVAENDAVPIPAHMTAMIVQLENGPELAYHLGKNPDVAERLSKLPPAVAVYELGRVAANLAAPKPEVSKAPPPIKPVGSRAGAGRRTIVDVGSEPGAMDEYAQMRKSQDLQKWREQHGMVNGQTH